MPDQDPTLEPQPGSVAYACVQWLKAREVYPRFPVSGGQVMRAGEIGQPPSPLTAAPAAPPTPQPTPAEWTSLGPIYVARLARQGTGVRGGPQR
jgi:hypothetical protein